MNRTNCRGKSAGSADESNPRQLPGGGWSPVSPKHLRVSVFSQNLVSLKDAQGSCSEHSSLRLQYIIYKGFVTYIAQEILFYRFT